MIVKRLPYEPIPQVPKATRDSNSELKTPPPAVCVFSFVNPNPLSNPNPEKRGAFFEKLFWFF